MGELEGYPVVDLTRPHGFLVWKGKQRAIVSPTLLPVGEVMITSDGEMFGIATLGESIQISLSEFEQEDVAKHHRIRPEERQELWPTADTFHFHAIKEWKGFSHSRPIAITLQPDVLNGVKDERLATLLESVEVQKDVTYDLVLVQRPSVRGVKKKELTMPYELNDDDCVVNIESGEIEKCHDSHEEALAHLQALNIAYVEEKKTSIYPGLKEAYIAYQEEVSRIVSAREEEKATFPIEEFQQTTQRVVDAMLAVEGEKVTKTDNGQQFSRSAYLYTPSDEVSEWKLRIEATPGSITKAQLGAAAAALSSGGFRGQRVSIPTEDKEKAAKRLISEYRKLDVEDDDIPSHLWSTADMSKPSEKAGRRLASSMLQRLRDAKDALQELMGWAEYADQEPEEELAFDMIKGGIAVKMVGGEPWHLSWSSNSFEDRDGEIFSLNSLEQYVRENEENEVKGWFNLWHIPHTDFAEKRYQAIIGKFLFEAGPYLKDAKGQSALTFFKQYSSGHPDIAPEGWGSSVEYKYLPEERKSKVYEWTWITRTSTLARGAAANVWTKSSQEEFIMNDEQKKAAVALFGEEFTNGLIAQGTTKTKELEDAGVAHKQATEVAAVEATPAVVEEVAEVPTIPDATQLITDLAAQMMSNVNEALTPVLTQFQQQIAGLGEQVKTLGEELKALKGDQALKEKVELPRFTFDLIRASQAKGTAVPEGDSLKNQKPQEVDTANYGGSLAPAYFPTTKR